MQSPVCIVLEANRDLSRETTRETTFHFELRRILSWNNWPQNNWQCHL